MADVFMNDSQYDLLMQSFSPEEQAEFGVGLDEEVEMEAPIEGDEYDDMPWLKDEVEGEEEEETDAEDEEVEEGEGEDEEIDEDEIENEAFDVDFDTVITLPNGEDMSIEDLYKGFKAGSEFEQEVTEFKQQQEEYMGKFSKVDDMLNLAVLEAERVVEDYKDFEWDKMAQEDPKAFVDNKRFLEQYQARLNELREAQNYKKELQAQEEERTKKNAAMACVKELARDIPEWNEDLYQKLMDHGIKKGIPESFIVDLVEPGAFKVLYDSYMREQGKAKAVAKIRKSVKSAKKVTKQEEGRVGVKKNANTARKKIAENFRNNPSDQQSSFEFANAFGFFD